MKAIEIFKSAAGFLRYKINYRIILLILLFAAAYIDFFILDLARRTFVFYNVIDGSIEVEDRMIKRTSSREMDITRYIEEALLGPAAPDLIPLFPRGTRLKSLLYRDGIVYADLSEDAVLPPIEGGRTLDNFRTLHEGVLRNFIFVEEVRFFIEGTAIYVDEFFLHRNGT